MTSSTKSYSKLITLPTFEERFIYLKLDGTVGEDTYGFRRWLNQELYHSSKWRRFRDEVILRDNGCDLAMEGFEIFGSILIHHLNPISYNDILDGSANVYDLDNVICTQHRTHNAIHYGDEHLLSTSPIQRSPNDTCPWKNYKGGSQ